MRVLILSANETRQVYFIKRLATEHVIVGVIVDQRFHAGDRLRQLWRSSDQNLLRLAANLYRKLALSWEEARERKTHERYFGLETPSHMAQFVPHLSRDINAPETVALAGSLEPDVIVVFGTRLLRDPWFQLAPRGAINLHTGLSPYYRGGHSTFFCLYNDEPQYIGATIHRLDAGIDSGEILLTGRPAIEAGDTLYTLECKVIVLGTDLMLEALRRIERDAIQPVPQWTNGWLYYSRDFTLSRRRELQRRMKVGLLAPYIDRPDAGREMEVKLIS